MPDDRLDLVIEPRPDGLAIVRPGGEIVLQQHVGRGRRPFVHPIQAPGGAGVVTEDAPDHHPWQHGLYIGLNDVNGVGFWTEGLHPERGPDDGGFDSRLGQSANVIDGMARWSVATTYRDRQGDAMLGDHHEWALVATEERLELDLTWELRAARNLTFGAYEYGGLFLRMPYRSDVGGMAVDSEGQSESGRRARWVAVRLLLPDTGRLAVAALMDHPDNPGFPPVWRIDNELGIGPSPSAAGAWSLAEDETTAFRYRLVVLGQPIGTEAVDDFWERFAEETT